MNPALITPVILTWNEAPNIERTLERLRWANRVVVLDSGSTDETLAICSRYPNVEVIHRTFDSFAAQCNAGLERVETEWVLSLDADYVVPPDFPAFIDGLDGTADGYRFPFRYLIEGMPLRGSLYPPRTVLYRRDKATYEDDGHGHRVTLNGRVQAVAIAIDHDDRKPLSRWLDSQRKYAVLEADKLLAGPARKWPDRIRQWIWPLVPLVFLYTLFVKGCLLDGWPGLHYTLQRTVAEAILAMELLGRRLSPEPSSAIADGSSATAGQSSAPAARRGGG